LQIKLLRVLQEREYEPLGATATVKSDVRVIVATNRSLAEQVTRGIFREDLYYRMNVVRIALPSLAERREDIPLLTHHFIQQIDAEQGKRIEGISDEALALIIRHTFPGNVRKMKKYHITYP
jgi:transcriptional regulator with PAS, ATPase and Fis domain